MATGEGPERPVERGRRVFKIVAIVAVVIIAMEALAAIAFVWMYNHPWDVPFAQNPGEHHDRAGSGRWYAGTSTSGRYSNYSVGGSYAAESPLNVYYNVTLDNGDVSAPTNQVADGKSVAVNFYMGPDDARNILKEKTPSKQVTEDIGQAASGVREFQVAMRCVVCLDDAYHTRTVYFDTSTQASNHVNWTIVPLAGRAVDGVGDLQFIISYKGEVHDTRSATIAFPGTRKSVIASAQAADADCPPPEQTPPEGGADLVINVGVSAGAVTYEFDVENDVLRAALKTKTLGPDGNPRTFRTTLDQPDQLQSMSRDVYNRLCAYTDWNECPQPEQSDSQDDTEAAKLTAAQAARATAVFYKVGTNLYDALISNGDDLQLRAVFAEIEAFGDTQQARGYAPRIVIHTAGVGYIPWQLLHAVRGVDAGAKEFWGNKFVLATDPLNARCGRRPAVVQAAAGNQFLLLQYRNPRGDPVSEMGAKYAAALSSAVKSSGLYSSVYDGAATKSDVDNFVAKKAGAITLISAFTHGDNGLRAKSDEDGSVQYHEKDPDGPSLLLSPSERLHANDIGMWERQATVSNHIFSAWPIVFLNGCDTGTVGGYSLSGAPTFQKAFLNDGARAVVVTEAPIPADFAVDFGEQFLQRVFRGIDVARALQEARKYELEQNNNPLGLLYSLYGNDNARMGQASN
jgi:hypothetical protein